LRTAGVLGPEAQDLAETWGSWKIADLVRQPAIRHSFVHLGKAHEIKRRIVGGA
jgi:hypothetical protein